MLSTIYPHNKIQQTIGPHEDLLAIVKRRKLTKVVWTCLPFNRSDQNHLARHGERGKKTRQKKRWEDNIRKWTGLELAKSQRAVENREKSRKPSVKSSVPPNDPRC